MFKLVMIIFCAEVVTAVGQILFKKSANSLERYSLRGLGKHIKFIRSIIVQPSIWLGGLSMIIGLAIWIIALAQGDLSLVFSLGSMQYIFILFGAHIFLGEKIDRMKLTGTLLVVAGIVLITLSK